MAYDPQEFSQHLLGSDVIYVKQRRELTEILTGLETRNRFRILSATNEELGTCAEQGRTMAGALSRNFWQRMRPFEMIGYDRSGYHTFRITSPVQWWHRRATIYAGHDRPIAYVQQQWGWPWRRKFQIQDRAGQMRFEVNGSIWRFWIFPIMRQGRTVAVIQKLWSGALQELFTDADNYCLRFGDRHLTAEDRLTLLAVVSVVDFMYFER
ncbi:MAG: hypothetical protein HC919_12400 [Oscillatoriales cyanobacterium SM2_2_1]|nr:hypothetical protein [Oscillatoriales cyanobacterium SM2_2_1]